MRANIRRFFAVLAIATLSAVPVEAQYAFENANVIPMTDDQVREGWTVLVEGDRITAAGPASDVEIPAGATRIDASGMYLIPGLAEMHGHVPSGNTSSEYVQSVLAMYVANGVTTVRGMLGGEGQLALREQANSGEIISPSLYLAGPPFSGGSIDSPEQAAELARQYAEEGWDFLKVLPGLTREEYDAMAESAKEAGIPFIGHVPQDVGIEHAIEMGQETIDHLDGYIEYLNGAEGPLDEARLQQIVEMTRQHDVSVVPTMALWEVIIGAVGVEEVSAYPELAYMPDEIVRDWTQNLRNRRAGPRFDQARVDRIAENRIRLLRALHEGGVRILMGTDSPQEFSVPGFSLRRELPAMLDAGMTPYDILMSGTRNVGAYLEDKDAFGTIEPGMRADIVMLDGNPLEDINEVFEPAGVMVRGRWLDREALDMQLQNIADRN